MDRGSLDPLLEALRQLRNEGKTVCLVEHNIEVVSALADRVYFMVQGAVMREGRMADIMADPKCQEVYFGHA